MGAAPLQNIGAYGVEVADVIVSCEVYDMETRTTQILNSDTCLFGYRDSVFKQSSGRYLIGYVTMRLSKIPCPILTYAPVTQALDTQGICDPTQAQIADTIESIRRSKLPRPEKIGNVGSFFKNPIIESNIVQKLLEKYPQMPHFIVSMPSLV
jgi:UDP-N-acetylmuramate dehydrogenase